MGHYFRERMKYCVVIVIVFWFLTSKVPSTILSFIFCGFSSLSSLLLPVRVNDVLFKQIATGTICILEQVARVIAVPVSKIIIIIIKDTHCIDKALPLFRAESKNHHNVTCKSPIIIKESRKEKPKKKGGQIWKKSYSCYS